MTETSCPMPRTMRNMELPQRMRRLPRDEHGYPIPWFVATLDDGSRDFRIASADRQHDARRFGLCWVCGSELGRYKAFPVGPMCAVNRVSSEPPCHLECATYSARCCPFLATPQMVRREGGKPDRLIDAAGHAILRNPGVTVVWLSLTSRPFRAQVGRPGWLWDIGAPAQVFWYAQGRKATREEILTSIDTGLPALHEACQLDRDPAGALAELDRQLNEAMGLVPA